MKKVAVLLGGLSKEREISLRSGKAIAGALKRKGHDVTEIDVGPNLIQDLTALKPDVAYLALHGKFGEDGTIQGLLEWLRIPYTGPSVLASSICADKLATKQFLISQGVVTPQFRIYRKSQNLQSWLAEFNLAYPVIVKPNSEGSTIGITRAFEKNDLKAAVEEALKFDSVVLVEQYIKGRELTVAVYQGRALPIVEVVAQSGFYDFESKYTPGKTVYKVPAPISEGHTRAIQAVSEKIYAAFQCEGAVRIDFMLDEKAPEAEGFYFLEVNTIPGMTETSLLPKSAAQAGLPFDDLCDGILKTARLKIS